MRINFLTKGRLGLKLLEPLDVGVELIPLLHDLQFEKVVEQIVLY